MGPIIDLPTKKTNPGAKQVASLYPPPSYAARASTATATWEAPAANRAFAASLQVAPVVNTSSTKRMRF